jgi:hypothetical protein
MSSRSSGLLGRAGTRDALDTVDTVDSGRVNASGPDVVESGRAGTSGALDAVLSGRHAPTLALARSDAASASRSAESRQVDLSLGGGSASVVLARSIGAETAGGGRVGRSERVLKKRATFTTPESR